MTHTCTLKERGMKKCLQGLQGKSQDENYSVCVCVLLVIFGLLNSVSKVPKSSEVQSRCGPIIDWGVPRETLAIQKLLMSESYFKLCFDCERRSDWPWFAITPHFRVLARTDKLLTCSACSGPAVPSWWDRWPRLCSDLSLSPADRWSCAVSGLRPCSSESPVRGSFLTARVSWRASAVYPFRCPPWSCSEDTDTQREREFAQKLNL